MRKIWANILVLTVTVIFCLIVLEIMVRALGHSDATGQFYFGGRKIRPYTGFEEQDVSKINKFIDISGDLYLQYDEDLGWDIEPDYPWHDNYKSNSQGIRSEPREFAVEPELGVLRIALFGDSFVHGDERPYNETFAHYLESYLNSMGTEAEVLDFGVPGYGMDQAYLRYDKLGKRYNADIVIIGFQAENLERNINLFRLFYYKDEEYLPLAKPRFIIEDSKLKLINSPPIPPDQIIGVIVDDPSFFERYDYFFTVSDRGVARFLMRSRLLGIILTWMLPSEPRYYATVGESIYDPEGEPVKVTMGILDEFVREATSDGSRVYLLHIPKYSDLYYYNRHRELPYQPFFGMVDNRFDVIDLLPLLVELSQESPEESLYGEFHYSDKANNEIGRYLAEELIR